MDLVKHPSSSNMSDSDYLAFSTDSPKPRSAGNSGSPSSAYQPYPRQQQRLWQPNHQNHQKSKSGQGNRFYNNQQQHSSGGNRFHHQHNPKIDDSSFSPQMFGNSPDRPQFQNYSNSRHNSAGGGRKPFRGRHNNGRQQQRSGFGFRSQNNQQGHFQSHSPGNQRVKLAFYIIFFFNDNLYLYYQNSNCESYFHPSMVEDPWSWFEEIAGSKDQRPQSDRSEENSKSDDELSRKSSDNQQNDDESIDLQGASTKPDDQ